MFVNIVYLDRRSALIGHCDSEQPAIGGERDRRRALTGLDGRNDGVGSEIYHVQVFNRPAHRQQVSIGAHSDRTVGFG